MKKKRDIQTTEDIQRLVDRFYKKIQKDTLLKDFFGETNWDKHLPLMYTFWENIAFYSGAYSGDPMSLHRHINQLHSITPTHFEQWIKLFNATVDEDFEGETATLVKEKAKSIAHILRSNIN